MTTSFTLSLRNYIAPLGILVATLFAFAPQAEAQCLTPDGYDSAICCTPVTPKLPEFPPSSLPGKGICWTDCTLSSEVCTKIALSAPTPALGMCTQYISKLEVSDCINGAPLMKGILTLDYTRTWSEEVSTGPVPIQIWRFAAKVDIVSPVTEKPLCPVPSCAKTGISTAFYYGYVDYALDCGTGVFETALVLYHGCDEFVHNPVFSAVPGTYHPSSTYAIVAPHTEANPFVPAVVLPPSGILVNEAMRNVTPNAIGTCNSEERVQQGIFQPLVTGCLCPLNFSPPQQAGVKIDGAGLCGGSFQSLNLWPLTPWYELVTTSIGRWTNFGSYPGPEAASVAEGLLIYTDACPTTGITETSFDIFYGGMTVGGSKVSPSPTIPQSPPLSSNFVDIASNYSSLVTAPIVFPLFGVVGSTDHLIYVNP